MEAEERPCKRKRPPTPSTTDPIQATDTAQQAEDTAAPADDGDCAGEADTAASADEVYTKPVDEV